MASPACRPRSPGFAGDVARSRRGRRSCIGVSRMPRRSPFRSCGWRSCPSRCGARCCRSSASSRAWSCPSGVRRSPRWCGCRRSRGHGRASARRARHRGRRSPPCAYRSAPFASSSTTTPIRRRPPAAATCDSSPAAGHGWSWVLSWHPSPPSPHSPPGRSSAAEVCSRSQRMSSSCGRMRPMASAPQDSTRSGRQTRSRRCSPCSEASGRSSPRARWSSSGSPRCPSLRSAGGSPPRASPIGRSCASRAARCGRWLPPSWQP